MTILGKPDGEVEIRLDKLDLHTWVLWGVIGWNFDHGQFAVVKRELLDGLGVHLNSLPDPYELIRGCELERCGLVAVMEDSYPD